MIKKRGHTIFFIILIATAIIGVVLAEDTPCDETTGEGCKSSENKNFAKEKLVDSDYSNSVAWKDGSIISNPSFSWDKAWALNKESAKMFQDKVPVEKIGGIPVDLVDVLKVKDPSKLISDQLLYNKNLNKFSDVKVLDESVLREALSQFAGIGVQLQAGETGTKVTLKDGGIVEINKGTTLSLGDNINSVGIAGFTGARYDGKTLLVQSGTWATQKKSDEVLTTTQNFKNLAQDTKKNSMIVDSAQEIITRYSTVHNVKKSLITQKGDSTTLLSLEKQYFKMNNNGEEIRVQAENQGSVTTSKDSLKAEKVDLSFGSLLKFANSPEEKATSDIKCSSCNKKIVSSGSCWTLSEDSSYTFSTIATSIQFKTPDLLCIVEKPYTCNDCSIFNTNDRTITTKSSTLNINKSLKGFDEFSVQTIGDAEYVFSSQMTIIHSINVSKSSIDSTISKYVKLKKDSDWFIRLENVHEIVSEQIKSIIDGKNIIIFDAGNLTATSDNEKISIVHKPQESIYFPEKFLAFPFIFSALLLLRRKGQTTQFMIIGIIVVIVGLIIMNIPNTGLISGSQNSAEFFAKSCFDSSVEHLETAISKQGRVPLKYGDNNFNVSIFLNDDSIQQPLIDDAVSEHKQALLKLYSECTNNFKSITEVSSAEEYPSVSIQYTDKGALYSLQPATTLTYANGNKEYLRSSFSKTTKYSYKKFHDTSRNFILSIKDTGFTPLFSEGKTDFWMVNGVEYFRLENINGEMYTFATKE